MFATSLLKKLTGIGKGQQRARDRRAGQRLHGRSRLRVEALEDRRLLSATLLHSAAHVSTAATTPLITFQTHPTNSTFGQSVALVAKLTGASGGSVEFFDSASSSTLGTELGTAVPVSNIGFATYVANALTLGANYLTAEYFLPTNTTTTADATATTTDTVTAAPTHTTIGASSNPGVQGANVTFTATVGGGGNLFAGKSASPSGSVTFMDGTTVLSANVALGGNGTASYTTNSLALGTHDVFAIYSPGGNSDYLGSNSRGLNEQIVAGTSGSVTGSGTLQGSQRSFALSGLTVTSGLVPATASVTYSDTSHNNDVSFTSTAITSVVFSSNSHQAEITGTGSVTTGSSTTPITVNFTMFVDSGSGHGLAAKPDLGIAIYGAGFNYNSFGVVNSGSIGVVGTGSTPLEPVNVGLLGALEQLFANWGNW
jgi:hypothetical protein